MPGTYTGEFIVVVAPCDGRHKGKRGWEDVVKGHSVYMHPGHRAEFGNLVVDYPHNSREGQPYITLNLQGA